MQTKLERLKMNSAQLIIETDKLSRLKTSHILHLLMSLVTFGVWVPIWILVSVNTAIERKRAERRLKRLLNGEIDTE